MRYNVRSGYDVYSHTQKRLRQKGPCQSTMTTRQPSASPATKHPTKGRKYIDFKHHFLTEHLAQGLIDIRNVLSPANAADALTKPFRPQRLQAKNKLLSLGHRPKPLPLQLFSDKPCSTNSHEHDDKNDLYKTDVSTPLTSPTWSRTSRRAGTTTRLPSPTTSSTIPSTLYFPRRSSLHSILRPPFTCVRRFIRTLSSSDSTHGTSGRPVRTLSPPHVHFSTPVVLTDTPRGRIV